MIKNLEEEKKKKNFHNFHSKKSPLVNFLKNIKHSNHLTIYTPFLFAGTSLATTKFLQISHFSFKFLKKRDRVFRVAWRRTVREKGSGQGRLAGPTKDEDP